MKLESLVAIGSLIVAVVAIFVNRGPAGTSGNNTINGNTLGGNSFNIAPSAIQGQGNRVSGNFPQPGSCGCGGAQNGYDLASGYSATTLAALNDPAYPDLQFSVPNVPQSGSGLNRFLVGNGSNIPALNLRAVQ